MYGGGTELWKWKLNDTIVYDWFHQPVSLYRRNVYVPPGTCDARRFGGQQNCTHTEVMIYLSCCKRSFGDTCKIGYIEHRINKVLTSFSGNI